MSYSVQDIAKLFHIHPNAIRRWFGDGLMRIDKQKPYLVHGSVLYDYLKDKQNSRKHRCSPTQFYCCKCQAPRVAAGNSVNIKIYNQKQLLIFGHCSECNTKINRIGSVKKLLEYQRIFLIQTVHDQHIIDTIIPITKCYISKEKNNDTI